MNFLFCQNNCSKTKLHVFAFEYKRKHRIKIVNVKITYKATHMIKQICLTEVCVDKTVTKISTHRTADCLGEGDAK